MYNYFLISQIKIKKKNSKQHFFTASQATLLSRLHPFRSACRE